MLLTVTDTVKVKKTDLPVMPPSDQEILPSLDDEADEAQDDNDEDDMDDDEDMMADEADTDDDDYDSEEDDRHFGNDEDSWDSLSTPQDKVVAPKESTTTQLPSTTQKATELPTPASSSAAAVDPYFTHFDPREEHQSYKVKVRHLTEYSFVLSNLKFNFSNLGGPRTSGGNTS